ncbi:MAG: peptidase S10 [bacterium]|nr:peptidase S10 [bacterium]
MAEGAGKTAPAAPEIDEVHLAKLSVTRHSVKSENTIYNYTATTGNFLMKEEKSQKLQATVFFIAYTLDSGKGQRESGNRPVTFVFNGGPGSASLWLHMGALGPKRVKMSPEGFQLPQPFQYIDNPYSWLEFTDLVFIDPVGTGYSRVAPEGDRRDFHGVQQDVRSVGEFIRLYVTRYQRWLSPKYLCGESYGTTRAAGLSGYLQDEHGMFLQGIVLISAIMNFQADRFVPGNDLPYALYLPTYAATAWYHKKLPAGYEDLKTFLKEVEEWALTDYHLALAKGDKLTLQERQKVIDKLALYTGLPKLYIANSNLRISQPRFTRGLLLDTNRTVGRLDSRFIRKANTAERTFGEDPSYAAIYGPYTAAVNHYLRSELKHETDNAYRSIASQVYPWDWGQGNQFVNVAETLRRAILINNNLKVMIANGYYDQATPYYATDYTVSHMNLPESLAKNITMKYYESGHMMYIRLACLKKLWADVEAFYLNREK